MSDHKAVGTQAPATSFAEIIYTRRMDRDGGSAVSLADKIEQVARTTALVVRVFSAPDAPIKSVYADRGASPRRRRSSRSASFARRRSRLPGEITFGESLSPLWDAHGDQEVSVGKKKAPDPRHSDRMRHGDNDGHGEDEDRPLTMAGSSRYLLPPARFEGIQCDLPLCGCTPIVCGCS